MAASDARKAAERRPLCVILANSVWDVLVKCGATEERGREDFRIIYVTKAAKGVQDAL